MQPRLLPPPSPFVESFGRRGRTKVPEERLSGSEQKSIKADILNYCYLDRLKSCKINPNSRMASKASSSLTARIGLLPAICRACSEGFVRE